jgi:hypothetical protein
VLSLVLLSTIAVYLGYVILSANVAIIVVAKVLLHPIGTVIELVDVDLSVLYYPSIDNSVSYFGVYEFYYNRGYTLKGGFLSQLSNKQYLCLRNNCIVVYKYLLNSCFLVLNVNRFSRDTVDNNFIS